MYRIKRSIEQDHSHEIERIHCPVSTSSLPRQSFSLRFSFTSTITLFIITVFVLSICCPPFAFSQDLSKSRAGPGAPSRTGQGKRNIHLPYR